jgi:anti-sigma regulatory factor (Ser/Thr protein kinase)
MQDTEKWRTSMEVEEEEEEEGGRLLHLMLPYMQAISWLDDVRNRHFQWNR